MLHSGVNSRYWLTVQDDGKIPSRKVTRQAISATILSSRSASLENGDK